MKLTYTMKIDAPITLAFSCVNDPDSIKKWMHGVESFEYLSPVNKENPVGSKFKQKIREGGQIKSYEGEVIAYEKPKYLAVMIHDTMFLVTAHYRLSEQEDGCKLDYEADLEFHH